MHPDVIQDFLNFSFGSKKFYNSIHMADINYETVGTKYDVFEDLRILHKYFSNLKCVNLNTSDKLSLSEIGGVLKNWNINLLKFKGSKHNNEYSISSRSGCLAIYDSEEHQIINFKNLSLHPSSNGYTTQGDYVIFSFDQSKLKLDVEGVTKYSQDYKCLDLKTIDDS